MKCATDLIENELARAKETFLQNRYLECFMNKRMEINRNKLGFQTLRKSRISIRPVWMRQYSRYVK